MRAMILAAGRGQRMRPLTDSIPKPLLSVRGKPLIEWHVEALVRAQVLDIIINTDWLEDQIASHLGAGERWGARIRYAMEGRDFGGALETAGGIANALPLLTEGSEDAFWVISADIHAPTFDFGHASAGRFAAGHAAAHLWLVPNPPYHLRGDFGLTADGWGLPDGPGPDGRMWTYSNIGLFRAELFRSIQPGTRAALAPVLRAGMQRRAVSAEVFDGPWDNVGTPTQLHDIHQR